MLLVVSPNLCLDRIVVVRNFATDRVHRAESVTELASGKGLNVARAARAFGLAVTVVGIIGRAPGASAITAGARAHGVKLTALRVAGPVRVCTLIIDPERGETVINEPGPSITAETVQALLDRVEAGRRSARLMVLAGSLPPGMPASVYAEIIRRTESLPIILDATGDALRLGVAARPFLVKANSLELAESVGRPLPTTAEVVAATQEIARASGAHVLITLGEAGAVLTISSGSPRTRHADVRGEAAEGSWQVIPPPLVRASTIGAGDSLTAGLAAGLMQGLPLLDAARLGIAAAAADITTLLPGTIDRTLVTALLPKVKTRRLHGGTASEA